MKTLGGLLMFVGFFMIAGAAGTSDYETTVSHAIATPTWEIATIAVAGLAMMWFGSRLIQTKSGSGKEEEGRVFDYRDPDAIRRYNNRE